jgi:hypothetical protein
MMQIFLVIPSKPKATEKSLKYEMLRFAQHDKKNVGWALPTNSLEKKLLSEPYFP